MSAGRPPWRALVVTVSDRSSRGERPDTSGPGARRPAAGDGARGRGAGRRPLTRSTRCSRSCVRLRVVRPRRDDRRHRPVPRDVTPEATAPAARPAGARAGRGAPAARVRPGPDRRAVPWGGRHHRVPPSWSTFPARRAASATARPCWRRWCCTPSSSWPGVGTTSRGRARGRVRQRRRVSAPGWPARLGHGAVEVRPLRARDARAWSQLRIRNEAWLRPWEGRPPSSPPGQLAGRHTPAVFAPCCACSGGRPGPAGRCRSPWSWTAGWPAS
jgi:hypothetical protein